MKKYPIVFAGICILFFLDFQYTRAATLNWIGGYNNNFSQANNWYEGVVPGSGDVVQIGVSYAPTINTPVVSTNTSISSLVVGTDYSNSSGTNPIGIAVNSGCTLSVTNNITFETNVFISASSSYNISGAGTITAANMYIKANTLNLGLSLLYAQQVNCSINSLVLSGNLSLTSLNIAILLSQVAEFNLTAGTTEIDGNISTNNVGFLGLYYPPSYVVINPSSSAGATLQLNGATALSGLSASGTNYITFNNAYATVNYAGVAQTVYTSSAPLVYGGISYYNLTASGSATKTVGSGTLTVSNNLTLAPASSAVSFDLSANNTVSSIGNFSSNTLSTLIQGSGQNFVVTGTAINNGIIDLNGNSSMIFSGTSGLTNTGTINGLSGYTSQQNIQVNNGQLNNSGTINWYGIAATSTLSTATLSNSGTINQLSLGTISVSGAVTNSGTINKTNGAFLANSTYTNNTGGVFTGTTTNGTTSYSYFKGAYLNNGTLTCNAEAVSFFNNYTNNATFTAGSGMVYFTGSTKTLLDNSVNGTLLNNVTFNGTDTATMIAGTGNFAISPTGSLYMVSPTKLIAGSTTAGGVAYLTIMSGATSSGTVYTPAGTIITGNVNVQRYISSGTGARGYRLLSSPVNISLSTAGTGNLGLSYLNTNATFGATTYYGGFTEGPGTGFTTNGSTNPIIYLYDESRPTDNSSFVSGKNIGIYSITGASGSPVYGVTTIGGIPPVNTAGISIPVGNSYLWYFVGSDQSTVVATTRTPDATTLNASGYLNQGTSVPVKFWKTGSTTIPYDVTTGTTAYGINQVGNPYASTINLVTLYNDNYSAANPITPIFYELLPGGNYISYNASNGHTSDARASQYIVSGQGFLAQAYSASPAETLTFKEDQKIAYPSSFFSSTTPEMMLDVNRAVVNETNNAGLHLQLALNSTSYAQTGIYFEGSGKDSYVRGQDALQVDGGTPTVFLSSYSSDSVKLAINSMAGYAQGKRVRLYINAVSSGNYTLSLADLMGIDTTNYNVFLIDTKLQDSLDMVRYKSYTFNLSLADTNRFVLEIDHKPVKPYMLTSFIGQKVTTGVQLKWTAANAGNYTGYTLQKQNNEDGFDTLYSVLSDTGISTYGFIDTHPIIGNNVYRLAQNGVSGAITYSASVTVGYNSATPNGALTLYPNPAQGVINMNLTSNTTNSPAYVADIYNSSGIRMSHQTVSSSKWTNDVSSYKLGVYVMEIKDTNGNIIGQAKFMKVE